jgi:hypothetical protein
MERTDMAVIIRRVLVLAALCPFFPIAPDASAQNNMGVTPIETALLPRACWAQLAVPGADGEEFHIMNCGPAANHYCSGVLYMIRAKGNVKNKQTRLDLLANADIDVRYTEKAIADYPNCSIRESVAATRAEINNLLTIYGSKRPRAQ